MEIPEKVKIGLYEYRVEETDEVLLVDHKECKGRIEYDNLTIKIKKELQDQLKLQTLWHEIIHGIIKEFGINLDSEHWTEESKVDWIATGVLSVLKDNPELIK